MHSDKSDEKAFDSRAYRNALGCFATGVCLIVTEDDAGRARGITVNSFSSVSLAPPIILWSIDVSSDRFDLFMSAEKFSVNMLRTGHSDHSQTFAKDVSAELSGDQLARGIAGVPVFNDALSHIVCETAWRQKAGDHVVIFGNVLGFEANEGDALGFFRGKYVPVKTQES